MKTVRASRADAAAAAKVKSTATLLVADLRWHATMLTWALNRCEHIPHELIQLVKDSSHERLQRHRLGPIDAGEKR